jgi:hypothetical protein
LGNPKVPETETRNPEHRYTDGNGNPQRVGHQTWDILLIALAYSILEFCSVTSDTEVITFPVMTRVNSDGITQVLLYGDQTVEKLPAIRALASHAQSSSRVRQFLRDACDIVQIELARLRPRERANISDFQSLLGLAEDNSRRKEPNEIVATILMGIARLGELISCVYDHVY